MLQEKEKLIRREKRLLNKIKSPETYKWVLGFILKVFSLQKKFFVLKWSSYKKVFWIISITSFYFLWRKFWYIDDFIVHRKLRWRGVWKNIFTSIINKLHKDKNNYVFLLSKKDRKASHNIYKKFGFNVIALWIWILAYKKLRKTVKKQQAKKVLFVHGWWWDWKENWFLWLKKELENKWFQVFNPELPNSNNPKIDEQLSFLTNFYEDLEWVNYIVWHSLGCQLSIYLIEKLNLSWLKCIFVWPTYKGIAEELWEEVYWKSYLNLKKYFARKIYYKVLWNKYDIFLSKNDPYINMERAKKYYSKLKNVTFTSFEDKWHFNEKAW